MHQAGPQVGHERVAVGQGLNGFPPVPHHGAEEAQVGGGQHPPVDRRLRRRPPEGASVGVVDRGDGVFGAGGNGQADPDEALVQQQAVPRRPVGGGDGRTVGPIERGEQGISATGGREYGPGCLGAQAERVGLEMAAPAGPPVGAEALEERVASVDRTDGTDGPQPSGAIGRQEDLEGCPGRRVQPLAGRKGRLVGLAGEQQGSRAQRGQGHSVGLHRCPHFPAMRGRVAESYFYRGLETGAIADVCWKS